MTESMRTLAASAALFISSAFCPSGSVDDCTTSKPTSRAILKRSATESVAGNMLKTKPFLMDRLAGPAAGTAADVGAAARSSAAAPPPRAAEQAAVTDDLRNSRRDERSIFTPHSTALALAQLVQIEFRIVDFVRLHQLIPSDLASRIRSGARHHARKRGLRAFGRLIMEIAAGDAFDEGLLLFAVGEFEIGAEISGHREGLGRGIFRRGKRSLPRFVAPDTERAGIRRLRSSFRAEKAFGDVPPAFGELRGAERNVDGIRIVEEHMIVSVGVAVGGRPAHAPAGGGSLQRMGFEDPVANVDDVNVLFHDDVAGRTVTNAAHQFDERRAISNLKADVQAQFSFRALAEFDDSERAGNINRDGLLQIHVLSCGEHGFQMARMVVRRRGNHDGVDFFRGCNL